ncbi:peptide deformylase [Alicyclobacillus tolerans]|uniref:peptide deformylase n=1 Tax=Alicyclobacillus tolerans TaxID=90970 RepID=UPI001F008A3A|nr:peptide deformylase [Alicyclobacillus tolerans]MCF8565006.1 peptide deformylase [Alicyclobacillus tolerans]
MTVQSILQGDIPELRQTSSKVKAFDDNLIGLLADLAETLEAYRGLGLSAPQIGVLKRVIAIDVGQGVQEFINPEIIETSGEVEGYESCLSFPEHPLKIVRPKCIRIQAQNRFGEPLQIEAMDLLARVICHEIDHLNGVLFMDHLSEEDMFSQMLGSGFIEEEDQGEDGYAFEVQEEGTRGEEQAWEQELQLAADMLSELSWKLTLSLEILKDYEEVFNGAIPWSKLQAMVDALEETVQVVEGCIEQQQHP